MKTYFNLFLIGIVMMPLICSCQDKGTLELDPEGGEGYALNESTCTVEPWFFEEDGANADSGSRSELEWNSTISKLNFVWSENDYLTVYSKDGAAEVANQYKIKTYDSDRAVFELDKFQLSSASYYLAFGQKTTVENISRVNLKDRDHIEVDYDNQVQYGNGTSKVNTGHLGDYDFIAAGNVSNASGVAQFSFKHLGTVLYMVFKEFSLDTIAHSSAVGDTTFVNPADVEWNTIEMYADDNDVLQTKRQFGLSSGVQSDGSFAPAFTELTSEEIANGNRFMLTLKDETNPSNGVKLNAAGQLIAYMAIPPIPVNGEKKFVFRLTGVLKGTTHGDQTVTYYTVYRKSNSITSQKAVKMTMYPDPTSNFVVTVKVHLDWKNKTHYDMSSSRTGGDSDPVDPIKDPGLMEEFSKPKYLYAWIFAYDSDTKQNTLRAVKKLESVNPNDWKVSVDNYQLTYDFTFDVRLDANVQKCILYAIASKYELPQFTMNETIGSACEETVRAYTVSIPNSTSDAYKNSEFYDTENNTGDYASFYQDYIKTIWTTPYTDDDSYVGNVYHGMNANMHHVAAKIDVQWNSTVKVNQFSMTHLLSDDLKVFEPISNVISQEDKTVGNITNADFSTKNTGWDGVTIDNGIGEMFNRDPFDFNQETTNSLPAGYYEVSIQGFYRYGADESYQITPAINAHSNNTEELNAYFYVCNSRGDTSKVALPSIFDGAGEFGGSSTVTTPWGKVPNDMSTAAVYFAKGQYTVTIPITLDESSKLKIGIKKYKKVEKDWVAFDNVKLTNYPSNFNLDYQVSSHPDQWYDGRKVFYVPQSAPINVSGHPYNGYTFIYVNTDRGQGGERVVKNNTVPFQAEGVFPSWFRGKVTIK